MRMPKPKAGAFSRALVDLIETRLRALRLSVHAAEKRYGFPPESLRSVLKGSSPSVDRFKKICDALEIDFTLGATLDATPLGATPLGSTLGETPLGATPLGATLPTKLPTNFGGKVGGKVGGIVGGIVGGKVVRGRKGLGHAGRMGGREDGGKIDSCLEGVGIDECCFVVASCWRIARLPYCWDAPNNSIARMGTETLSPLPARKLIVPNTLSPNLAQHEQSTFFQHIGKTISMVIIRFLQHDATNLPDACRKTRCLHRLDSCSLNPHRRAPSNKQKYSPRQNPILSPSPHAIGQSLPNTMQRRGNATPNPTPSKQAIPPSSLPPMFLPTNNLASNYTSNYTSNLASNLAPKICWKFCRKRCSKWGRSKWGLTKCRSKWGCTKWGGIKCCTKREVDL